MDVCAVVCSIFNFIGILLLVVGTATDNWRKYEVGSIKVNQGLFRTCRSLGDSETCGKMYSDFGELKAKFAAVVVCMILSILIHFIGGCLALFGRICKRDFTKWVLLALVCTVLFAAGGLSIYAHNYSSGSWDLFWSYGLAWAGTGCVFIAGICLLVMALR